MHKLLGLLILCLAFIVGTVGCNKKQTSSTNIGATGVTVSGKGTHAETVVRNTGTTQATHATAMPKTEMKTEAKTTTTPATIKQSTKTK